jgi:acetyl esterase/lipase
MKSSTLILLTLGGFAFSNACAAPPAQNQMQRTVIPAETLAKLDAHTDLSFARYGNRELKLDLYRPKETSKPLPAVVCIHGGGWFQGDRASMRPLAQALAERGFVTITIDYRLSGEMKFPAQIEDCKGAVRWLCANAAKFGVDAQAIGVTGLSAGGHLAALLATSGGVKELEGDGGNRSQSSAVQACVAMGAQSDLETERIRTLSKAPSNPHYRPFLGGSLDESPKIYALASPRHHLDDTDPPVLFMTGELDDPSTHADEMRLDLEMLGTATGLKILPHAPHAFLGQQTYFDAAVNICEEFFNRHLRKATGH